MTIISTKKHGITALFTALVLLASFLLPLFTAQAALTTVKAKTRKGTYTIHNAIKGIDVSKWQDVIDWKKVGKTDVSFVMVRASYGLDADPLFVTNVNGAAENGLDVGAYHYARFKDKASMRKEAAFFLKQLKKVKLTYPVVLDIENHYNLSKKTLTALSTEFIDIIKDAGYKNVMIYTYQNFFLNHLNLSSLKNYDIWVANYGEKPTGIDYVMWQHSCTGRVNGIKGDVDLNVSMKEFTTARRLPTPSGGPSTTAPAATATAASTSTTGAKKDENDEPVTDTSSIKRVLLKFLQEQYSVNHDSNVGAEDLNLDLNRGLQIEVDKQLGVKVEVNGRPGRTELTELASIPFTVDKTKGRITTLVQGKLYLAGNTAPLTGVYDGEMVRALEAFQAKYKIPVTGKMDAATWEILLSM